MIKITAKQFEDLIQTTFENENLEFKEAKNTFPLNSLFNYCVAIANERGGQLILGVTDKLPRRVVGTKAFENILKTKKQLRDKLNFTVDIETFNHPQGRVLIFDVPSRPDGTAYSLEGKYLMRVGDSIVPMTEDKLRTIFSERQDEWMQMPSKEDLNQSDVIELLDTQTFFQLLNAPYPTHSNGVIEQLKQMRLIEEKHQRYTILRIGALLLAKNLDNFHDLKHKALRVIVYTSESKLNTKIDQTLSEGYAVGFQNIVQFIMFQLPQSELIESALRTEVKLAPEVVIRELVANALIHQDLTLHGMFVKVEIYSNRVEISSPGQPLVPVERFIDSDKTRNEALTGIMRRLGICEEKGSGIDRVINQIENDRLTAPVFEKAYERTVAKILEAKPFQKMSLDERIRTCYQHCSLKWTKAEYMNNESLRARFQLSNSDSDVAITSKIIRATIIKGLVKLDEVSSSRKFARYLPFWA